jgi:hypothetical protein
MNQVATCIACLLLQTVVTSDETVRGDGPKVINIERSWTGMLPIEGVARLPKAYRDNRIGIVSEAESWSRIWKMYQPGKKQPEVDFDAQFVVFIKNVRYLNRIKLVSAELADGLLSLKSQETRSARPIRDQVYCVMILIDREGIQLIRDGRNKITIE